MTKKSKFQDNRGIVEWGKKTDVMAAGRPPSEIAQMENDFARLEEYVDEAISHQAIRYRGKRLTQEDVLLIVKMLIVNRTHNDICREVNKQRVDKGLPELTKAEIGVWRFRGRYKETIFSVRKFLYESYMDIFPYTNPTFVVQKMNMLLNYLFFFGFDEGLKTGKIDKDTQGVIRLWMQGIRMLKQIIQINVEELEKQEEKAENINVVDFLKRIRKKFGTNASEQEMIDYFFRERYEAQLKTGVENEPENQEPSGNPQEGIH